MFRKLPLPARSQAGRPPCCALAPTNAAARNTAAFVGTPQAIFVAKNASRDKMRPTTKMPRDKLSPRRNSQTQMRSQLPTAVANNAQGDRSHDASDQVAHVGVQPTWAAQPQEASKASLLTVERCLARLRRPSSRWRRQPGPPAKHFCRLATICRRDNEPCNAQRRKDLRIVSPKRTNATPGRAPPRVHVTTTPLPSRRTPTQRRPAVRRWLSRDRSDATDASAAAVAVAARATRRAPRRG